MERTKLDYDLMALKNAKRIGDMGDQLAVWVKLETKRDLSDEELSFMADLLHLSDRLIKTSRFFQKYVRKQM